MTKPQKGHNTNTNTHLQELGFRLGVEVGGDACLLLVQGLLHPEHVGGGAILCDPHHHFLRVVGAVGRGREVGGDGKNK